MLLTTHHNPALFCAAASIFVDLPSLLEVQTFLFQDLSSGSSLVVSYNAVAATGMLLWQMLSSFCVENVSIPSPLSSSYLVWHWLLNHAVSHRTPENHQSVWSSCHTALWVMMSHDLVVCCSHYNYKTINHKSLTARISTILTNRVCDVFVIGIIVLPTPSSRFDNI